jgi:hypothetical protein
MAPKRETKAEHDQQIQNDCGNIQWVHLTLCLSSLPCISGWRIAVEELGRGPFTLGGEGGEIIHPAFLGRLWHVGEVFPFFESFLPS